MTTAWESLTNHLIPAARLLLRQPRPLLRDRPGTVAR